MYKLEICRNVDQYTLLAYQVMTFYKDRHTCIYRHTNSSTHGHSSHWHFEMSRQNKYEFIIWGEKNSVTVLNMQPSLEISNQLPF